MTKTNSVTKRMLALLLAALMMFSGMAVSASAADAATPSDPVVSVPTSVPAPTLSKSDADKTITVKLPVVAGYKVNILVEPSASYVDLNNGSYLYVNLTPGQKYTFKAYIAVNSTLIYSTAVSETIKDKHAAPAAPVATTVTSKSITAAKVTDCQYKLVRVSDQKVLYDWGDTVVFDKGLTANTAYLLSIRKKATSTKYASDPVSITVKTLRAGDTTAVSAPILVDKTNTTVTVKCADVDKDKKIEFSIDKGKTWQSSGEFKNLQANTIYGVIARRAYDPAVQDPNPSSKILEIRTNTRERISASLTNCTFVLDEGKVYANEFIGVKVTGDGPKDSFLAEYGDTRYIPKEVVIDGRVYELKGSGMGTYTGEILPGSGHANSTLTVSVVYTVERYNGGGDWKNMGTIESKQDIEVGPEKNLFTVIGEFFVSVFNALFNTIPELILSTGGLWEKGLALLFGMFDDIGITK